MDTICYTPIGIIESCFSEKFGAPRQSGLVPAATAQICIHEKFARKEAWADLNHFSHIWIIYDFNRIPKTHVKMTARPPRLGGNQRVGVFASRSPYRPNTIGLSSAYLESVCYQQEKVILKVSNIDLISGTPVLDIKPYLPYSDAHPNAHGHYAQTKPQNAVSIIFSEKAQQQCQFYENQGYKQLGTLIRQTLSLDPRPAYKNTHPAQHYGMQLYDLNIRWHTSNGIFEVTEIKQIPKE